MEKKGGAQNWPSGKMGVSKMVAEEKVISIMASLGSLGISGSLELFVCLFILHLSCFVCSSGPVL